MSVNLEKKVEISALYGVYGGLLTARQREVIEMFYDLDMSLAEIAESYGVTRQAVRDIIVRASDSLEGYERAIGACAFAESMTVELETAIDRGDMETVKQVKGAVEEKYGIISRSGRKA